MALPNQHWQRSLAFPAALGMCFIIAHARLFGAERDSHPAPAAAEVESQALENRIQKLIGQLGNPQYAARERAQSELKRLGLTAFDALYEAQNDEDIEISLRAQYLVRSLTVDWADEDDPIEVKRILRGYSDKKEKQRKTLMDQLAKLPDWMGADALARLARFERSPVLSKQAALLVMGLPFPKESQRRDRLAEQIEKTMELSRRPSAHWMRTYARTLRDPATSLDDWAQVIAEEERALDEFPGSKTNRQVVLDLLRWHAEFLLQQDRKSEAEEAMRRAVALAPGAREQIIETVDWLMSHEAWSLVEEIAARYRDLFEKDPLLIYRLAEAQLKRGQKELADVTARKAFEIPNDNMVERLEWAFQLQQSRGLIEWAEREYRHVIDKEPLVSLTGLRARQRLSEMLHDYQRDAEASEVYRPLVEAMEKDPNVERGVAQARGDAGGIKSRMYYFLAEAARKKGDADKQRENLERAVTYDPLEADALIAMHKSGGDDAFRQKARRLIGNAAGNFRQQIDQQRRQLEQIGNNDVLREQAEYFLAQYDNQFAWLVSNTFGDFQEALRLSHESLQLRPNTGAFLDTLAHCYAAVGDFENAVKYQSQAVEQEPHSSQIVRKLDQFRKELEKSTKKPSP